MSSKIIPNTFMCFNAFIDRAMCQLSDSELRVLVFATRHILGWQDRIASRRACISLTMFVDGFTSTDEDGTVTVYEGCGLGEAAVRAACNSLCGLKFLIKIGAPTERGQEWQLGDSPDWTALEARTAEAKARRKLQVEKATAAAAAKRNGVTLNDTPVTSDDTPLSLNDTPVTLNDGSGVSFNDGQQSHIQSHKRLSAPKNGAVAPPKPKPKISPRPRNELFDAVALHVFGTSDPNAYGGRIGKISSWLAGKSEGKRGERVGFISAPAQPKHVKAFAEWCQEQTITPPRDFVKFVENWRKWAQAATSGGAAGTSVYRPVEVAGSNDPPLTAEQRAALVAEGRRQRAEALRTETAGVA